MTRAATHGDGVAADKGGGGVGCVEGGGDDAAVVGVVGVSALASILVPVHALHPGAHPSLPPSSSTPHVHRPRPRPRPRPQVDRVVRKMSKGYPYPAFRVLCFVFSSNHRIVYIYLSSVGACVVGLVIDAPVAAIGLDAPTPSLRRSCTTTTHYSPPT
ncbi:hypothetical protein C8J57DRAFT_1506091 [Mycena rebaudengoi]|nr:hypothetical protein C8J57DRAFT_1506091 [Mycena rebaudengoi]